jgi:arginine exporter protein ArgO
MKAFQQLKSALKFTTRELQIFTLGAMVATLPWFIMFAAAFNRSCR